MSTDPSNGSANQDESVNQSGAEPVYGPAYGGAHTDPPAKSAADTARSPLLDAPSPPYTAPYPPYPSDVPTPAAVSTPVASGLAYFVLPAVFFLVSEPYRSNPLLRFHSWQAIFFFLAMAAVRVLELLVVTMLPVNIAYAMTGLLLIVLTAAWLIAVIKALQGSKWLLPVIGSYAEQTASTVSSR